MFFCFNGSFMNRRTEQAFFSFLFFSFLFFSSLIFFEQKNTSSLLWTAEQKKIKPSLLACLFQQRCLLFFLFLKQTLLWAVLLLWFVSRRGAVQKRTIETKKQNLSLLVVSWTRELQNTKTIQKKTQKKKKKKGRIV